jgi:hypothetical protein
MTTQNLRLKISSPSLKLLMLPRYPASIAGGTGIDVNIISPGALSVALDYLELSPLSSYDPSAQFFAVTDALGNYRLISLASIFTGAQTVQIITAAGDVTVQPNDGLIILNKTVGATTNVNLPAAALKVGDVKIVDWKNDSDVNNITLVPNGTEKINGLTGWKLAGQGASIILKPVSGTVSGYVA